MLREAQFSAKVQRQMRAEGVVFAYSQTQASEQSAANRGNLYASASALNQRLREWKDIEDWEAPWNLLEGARVLDIASGSSIGPKFQDRDIERIFGDRFMKDYPHFSRLAAINGAQTIAIDISPQSEADQKLFTGVTLDVIQAVKEEALASLPQVKDGGFDIINSCNFVGDNTPPSFESQLRKYGFSTDEFEQALVDQLKPLLAEGGLMDLDLIKYIVKPLDWHRKRLNSYYYKKSGGEVTEINRRF